MKYRAILFDMDGTLVPMDLEGFTRGYLKILFGKLLMTGKYQLDPKTFEAAMWEGVGAMIANDGSRTNAQAFWQVFEKVTGIPRAQIEPECDAFYSSEFYQAKQFTGENTLAKEAVRIAREKADLVILATNPLFPMVGQNTRMEWVGLTPEDFDLVTSYEEDRFCKPNPQYFLSVCDRMQLMPGECLMIGNDEREDMYAASLAGIDGYLVTDSLISSKEHPWAGPRGTFAEMVQMLRNL